MDYQATVAQLRRRALADGREEPALPDSGGLPELPTEGLPPLEPDPAPVAAHGCGGAGAPAGWLALLGALLGVRRRVRGWPA